jgi:acyl-coenzyme A thioesterase PaaI-like protein
MQEFGVEQARDAMATIFAPWIVDLGMVPISFDGSGGTFLLPENQRIVHIGGVICGQATASAADTACVLTLAALNGRLRMCTTVDLTTHFIRPLKPGDVEIRVELLSNGKRMAYTRVEMRAKGDNRLAVTAFAYLED